MKEFLFNLGGRFGSFNEDSDGYPESFWEDSGSVQRANHPAYPLNVKILSRPNSMRMYGEGATVVTEEHYEQNPFAWKSPYTRPPEEVLRLLYSKRLRMTFTLANIWSSGYQNHTVDLEQGVPWQYRRYFDGDVSVYGQVPSGGTGGKFPVDPWSSGGFVAEQFDRRNTWYRGYRPPKEGDGAVHAARFVSWAELNRGKNILLRSWAHDFSQQGPTPHNWWVPGRDRRINLDPPPAQDEGNETEWDTGLTTVSPDGGTVPILGVLGTSIKDFASMEIYVEQIPYFDPQYGYWVLSVVAYEPTGAFRRTSAGAFAVPGEPGGSDYETWVEQSNSRIFDWLENNPEINYLSLPESPFIMHPYNIDDQFEGQGWEFDGIEGSFNLEIDWAADTDGIQIFTHEDYTSPGSPGQFIRSFEEEYDHATT